MFKNTVISVGSFILALVLFSVPLWLKYDYFKPRRVSIQTGETLEVKKGFSNIWCESESIQSSTSLFDAYIFPDIPKINMMTLQRSSAVNIFTLPNGGAKIFGYRMLKGSNMALSACSKLSGAVVTLVRGYKNLMVCLREHSDSLIIANSDSVEDSESEESDEATSSISSSQGAVSNETDIIQVCTNALGYFRLQHFYRCGDSRSSGTARKFVFSYPTDFTDEYFVIFNSNTYLDILPNQFSIEFVFDRTHLDRISATTNCTNTTDCELPVGFSSKDRVYVDLHGANGSWKHDVLLISCRPRKSIFFLFYLGFTIIIFLCAFH